MIGRSLGDYRIEALIGQGGIGAVYRAFDPELGRAVALKLLRLDAVSPSQHARFEREAKALTALAHKHVVAILDCGVSEGLPYLAMELLEGQTLAQALISAPLPNARVTAVMRELLQALAFVHESGLVHRDLKPGNVFLAHQPDGGEQVKLLDFGLAKFLEVEGEGAESTLTRTGEVFGTPAYMAPEQWSGDKVDARADVYAAAVVCFEMLTGRRPFVGEGQALLRAQLVEAPPLVHEVCTDRVARPELEHVLQRALAKHARDRQGSAVELAAELKAVPEPWIYVGREATKARRKAATAVRTALDLSMAPTLQHVPGDEPRSLTSWVGTLFHRLALLGAWSLSVASLIVIGLAGTAIYLLRDDRHPEARKVLERTLPKIEHAVARGAEGAGAVVSDVVASAKAKVAQALPDNPARGATDAGEPDAAVQGDLQDESQTSQRGARVARAPARNPWKGPLPKELQALRWKIDAGQEGDREMLKDLRRYVRKESKDPRGPLLLARLYKNRGAWNDAIAQYRLAYERDASSRGDPRMLPDLVSAVARKESSWRATALIPVIYGPEALAEIKRALRRTRDNEERLRLEQLAHTLAP